MKKLTVMLVVISIIGLTLEFVWFKYLAAPSTSSNQVVFVVPQDWTTNQIIESLHQQKFIKNQMAFSFLFNNLFLQSVDSGGYLLSKNMNSLQVVKKITQKPDLLWFTISFCARKEQIGEKLADVLGWDQVSLDEWNNVYPNMESEYFEGVYYPDTYLLPTYESATQISQRFITRFNEKMAPLSSDLNSKNIRWTTVLKIASLIARESAGGADMPLVSGIIWNRLNIGMPLQIDSTMQYTYGKNEDGTWWGPIDLDQKKASSPYNSYLHKGLPPSPICSPNIEAIKAAVSPAETDCLFYLHDAYKEIHCAKTYAQHKENIKKYLSY